MSLGLDSANFDKGLGTARNRMRGAEKDFKTHGDRMEAIGRKVGVSLKTIVGLGTIGGIAGVVAALKGAVGVGLEYASSLAETAQQLGVTSAALQEYRYAASQVGISQEEMDQGLSKLTKSIGAAASGAKIQVEAFRQLGVGIKDAKGNVIDAGAAIPKLADGLAKIKSPAERATLELALFGKTGQKLDNLLAGGSAAVNELRDAAHKLGIVLSDKQIQDADNTADKLNALKQVLSARIAGAVADNAASILGLADSFFQLVGAVAKADAALRSFQSRNALGLARQQAEFGLTAGVRQSGQRKADNIVEAGFDGLMGGASVKDLLTGHYPGSTSLRGKDAGIGAGIDTSKPGKTPRAPKGPKGPDPRDVLKRFNDDLAGYAQQVLSARQSVAMSAQEAAELERRGLALTKIRTLDDIKLNKDYSETQKQRLRNEVQSLADAEERRVAYDLAKTLEDEGNTLLQQQNQQAGARLELLSQLADTDAEKQQIALQQLDLDDQFKRDSLQRIISSSVRTDAEKALAQNALDELNATAGQRRAGVIDSTLTPGQAFLQDLNKSPAQINEAIDKIKIDGLDALNQGLVDAIMGARSLGDVFSSVAKQIIADLLSIYLRKTIISALGSALNLGGSFKGLNFSNSANVDAGIATSRGLRGFAMGTNFAPGGFALVGEQGPELVNLRQGSQVIPNHELRGLGGGNIAQIVPSPYFDVVVNGHIANASGAIASAGADIGMARSAYRQGRRVA